MLNLFQRQKGGNWYYNFTIGGSRLYKSTGTKDHAQAQAIAAKAYAEAFNIIKLGEKPRYLWQQAVIRFINEGQQKKSLKTEKDHFRWLSPHLDGVYLDEITQDVIENLITEKLKTTGTTRVNRMTGIVSAVLNKAHKHWQWLETVPHIRKFKENNQRLRWLSLEEAERLLTCLNDHTKAMAEFTLATGLRQANVTGLEWTQIDMTHQIAWIHPDQSKNGKALRIPLNADAMRVLEQQRKIRQSFGLMNHNRVFTYKGNPIAIANTRAFKEALKKAGITDFCWHGLRHTWASWHVQAGTSLHELQELGGWKSIEMVQRYAHLAPHKLASTAANIERGVAKSTHKKKSDAANIS